MELHIHLHHHYDDKIFTEIKSINTNINNMSPELEALKTEVAETKTIAGSAITLLNGLKTKLDEAIANNNMQDVVQLRNDLDASNNELAAAITANTPVETGNGENGGETADPNANL